MRGMKGRWLLMESTDERIERHVLELNKFVESKDVESFNTELKEFQLWCEGLSDGVRKTVFLKTLPKIKEIHEKMRINLETMKEIMVENSSNHLVNKKYGKY